MGIRGAIGTGARQVEKAWRLVLVAYLVNLAVALPLAATMRLYLEEALAHTVAADNLRRGWDDLWYRGFSAQAHGLAATFRASVVGIGAVLDALDDLLRGALLDLHPGVVTAGLVYLVAWVFLGGGLLARFLHREGSRGFFADAARHFPRMLAISAGAWIAYGLLLRMALPALGAVVASFTRETVDERVQFAWVLGKYVVVWLAVWSVSLVSDYAKITAVGRPAVSLREAVARGLGFVRDRPVAVFGLSATVGLLGLAVVGAYRVVAPGPEQSNGFQLAIAFAISQTYVVAKVALRALLLASQASLAAPVDEGVEPPLSPGTPDR